ncbi:hypothetical protein U9M48_041887 [Paspalum notatum var. saurae]|uniref:Uncharacterized protein n=1 Tax=Paspalum notatum var. saurae TaxID=547442 RepID=A0AAQ3XFD9_PASNO
MSSPHYHGKQFKLQSRRTHHPAAASFHSPLLLQIKPASTHTMSRTKNPLVAEGAVSVQKVEKIEPVYNLVSRPSVYPNPRSMMMVAPKPPAGVSAVVFQRMPSKEEIDDYIRTKKQQFAFG